ncbi:MAG: hypothetical protein K0Q94_264 [Paenibacillus sp.]|nr:hypothetical protein [Paenibacillus sp.]
MSTAIQLISQTKRQLVGWSWLKKSLLLFTLLIFGTSSFLYLTSPGLLIREFLAQTVISTQHRDWAWIFVGAEKRDYMVKMSHQFTETSALEKQDLQLIKHDPARKARSVEELISEPIDISDKFWKGKMIYVYDPTSVRIVTPHTVGEGERISSMVTRTGAVAGINGGGFIDPDGLGNGFAPIGLIMSGFDSVYTDVEPETPQHIVGFTKEGTLVVGKYSLLQLKEMGVKEAVSFLAPRLIANGNPQITNGDGGWGRAPRTAIGQKEDGTLIFVVIDGRQTHSVGATLKEVQDLLLKEGAVNAGMMDGGASSELVVKGELLTKPSSRYGERRLPSGLLVYDDPDSYKVDRVWDGLLKINAGGAFDHPDYLKDLERQKQQQQQTKQQEPAKTQEPPKTDSAPPATTKPENPKPDTPASKPDTSKPPAKPNAGKQEPPTGGTTPGGTGTGTTNTPVTNPGTTNPGTANPGAANPGTATPGGNSLPASGGTGSTATGEPPDITKVPPGTGDGKVPAGASSGSTGASGTTTGGGSTSGTGTPGTGGAPATTVPNTNGTSTPPAPPAAEGAKSQPAAPTTGSTSSGTAPSGSGTAANANASVPAASSSGTAASTPATGTQTGTGTAK